MTNREAQENIRAWVYWLLAKEEDIPEDVIKALDTAQIALNERPQGEWIDHENHIECNKCQVWFLKDHLIRKSFCPNCGADMRGEQNA